jgi:hypothetical protein
MTEIDPIRTVLARAKACAEADGFAWNIEATVKGKRRLLSEARRRFYIQNAREELSTVSRI